MFDEITESAKAAQETAKTVRTGIEATQELGRFVSRITAIPYKLALPIIEHASLEDNDELQDLWANLIASAVDPLFEGPIRTAYFDIIKQLEAVDVHILNVAYESYKNWLEGMLQKETVASNRYYQPSLHSFGKNMIIERLAISPYVYENSIDNLVRVRCLGLLYARNTDLFITSLGVNFVEACTGPTSRDPET